MAFTTLSWLQTTVVPDVYTQMIQTSDSTFAPLNATQNATTDPGVWKKSLPVQLSLGVLGILGNLLSLLVFTRPAFAKMRSSVFLRALSTMDIILILVFDVNIIHTYILYPDPSSLAEVRFNPVGQWVLISCATSSAWTIVAVSIERSIAVCLPLKVKIICTKRNAFITCLCLYITLFIINTPTIVVKPGPHDVLPLPLYFSILYSVVPSSIIMVCNVILIYKVHNRHGSSKKDVQNRGITIMLIVNSIGFVGCTLPYSIFHLMGHKITDEIRIVRLLKILESLSALNHSVNFIFYGLSGSLFRRELRKLLCGKCSKDDRRQNPAVTPPTSKSGGTSTSGQGRNTSRTVDKISKSDNKLVSDDSGVGSEINGDSSSGDQIRMQDVSVIIDNTDGMVNIPLSDSEDASRY